MTLLNIQELVNQANINADDKDPVKITAVKAQLQAQLDEFFTKHFNDYSELLMFKDYFEHPYIAVVTNYPNSHVNGFNVKIAINNAGQVEYYNYVIYSVLQDRLNNQQIIKSSDILDFPY